MKNDPFDKSPTNNILCFASKYLKRTFVKKLHEIGSIKYGSGIKYFSKTVQHVQYFSSKYLKRTFGKKSYQVRSVKYGPAIKYSLTHFHQCSTSIRAKNIRKPQKTCSFLMFKGVQKTKKG